MAVTVFFFSSVNQHGADPFFIVVVAIHLQDRLQEVVQDKRSDPSDGSHSSLLPIFSEVGCGFRAEKLLQMLQSLAWFDHPVAS